MKMLNWQTRDTRRSAFLSLNEASKFYVIESITFNLAHCTRDGFLSHLLSAFYTISSDSSAFACLWSYRPRTCRVGNDYRTSQQPEQREEWESEIEFHPWIRFMMSLSQYHHHPTNNDSSQESWAKNKMMKKKHIVNSPVISHNKGTSTQLDTVGGKVTSLGNSSSRQALSRRKALSSHLHHHRVYLVLVQYMCVHSIKTQKSQRTQKA